MNDINLFESFISKNKEKPSDVLIWLVIALLIAVFTWPAINLSKSYNIRREIAFLEAQVLNDKNYPLLNDIDELNNYISVRRTQLNSVIDADSLINENEWIKEQLLLKTLRAVPRDVHIEYLSMDSREIVLKGGAANTPAIAELLKQICVSSITQKDGLYFFNMTSSFKG